MKTLQSVKEKCPEVYKEYRRLVKKYGSEKEWCAIVRDSRKLRLKTVHYRRTIEKICEGLDKKFLKQ